MKSKILLASIVFALAALAVPLRSAPTPPVRDSYTGTVVDWHLDMDGTVYLLLESAGAGGNERRAKARRRWFRTPPDRSVTFPVEQMVLDVLLERKLGSSLEVFAEGRPGDRGEKPSEAIELVWISPD